MSGWRALPRSRRYRYKHDVGNLGVQYILAASLLTQELPTETWGGGIGLTALGCCDGDLGNVTIGHCPDQRPSEFGWRHPALRCHRAILPLSL